MCTVFTCALLLTCTAFAYESMLSTSVTAALKNRLSVVERSMYEMAKKVQINVDVTSDVACPW